MKRFLPVIFMLLVLALAGCSSSPAPVESAAELEETIVHQTEQPQSAENISAPAESAAEMTEVSAEETVTAPDAMPVQPESASEEVQAEVAQPEEVQPEETAPGSLREFVPAGPVVMADGTALDSLNADGVTLVSDTTLMEAYPWLQRNQEEEYPTYTDRSGNTIALTWTATDGSDYAYPGSGAVCFSGEGVEYWLPLREMTELLGLSLLWDDEWKEAFVSEPVDTAAIQQGVSVPVLMYHETSDELWGIQSLFVSPDNLREQLQYLQDNGYDPIFFSDLTHLEDYDKPVILTCDDGYIGNYTYLYPLLKEFNMKATIFVIAGMVGDENYMTAEQIKELSDSGLVEIESHTENHYQLATLSADDQRYEMEQSRLEIARITGQVPYVLAYPNGSNDGNTRTIGPEYYTFGVLMNGGTWNIWGDWFGITRSYVDRDIDIAAFAELLR